MGNDFSAYRDARKLVIRRLRRDLVGPSWVDGTHEPNAQEILYLEGGNPANRYLSGYLEPARNEEILTVDDIPKMQQSTNTDLNSETPFSSEENEDERNDSSDRDVSFDVLNGFIFQDDKKKSDRQC